ncbi:hypothetical protein [Nostoc sp.]|uniref:hypothetical protein n=1 Tax=Nostoc sp. TaxID=1180 RepID=UPI002FF4BA34
MSNTSLPEAAPTAPNSIRGYANGSAQGKTLRTSSVQVPHAPIHIILWKFLKYQYP